MKTINHENYIPTAQGDLLILPAEKVPDMFKKSEDRILAHSETGHHHVAVGDLDVYRNPTDPMLAYLVARGPVEIEHKRPWDTHESLKLLGEGEVVWEIRRQREYVPEGWRRVED